jgi:hypothetical protein
MYNARACIVSKPIIFSVCSYIAYLQPCRKAATAREQKADDINKMVAYFQQCKEENQQFFWDFECDEECVIQNLFWSHASTEFADFGDAVTFDTTYKTNVYNMPLAMFVGSNHKTLLVG